MACRLQNCRRCRLRDHRAGGIKAAVDESGPVRRQVPLPSSTPEGPGGGEAPSPTPERRSRSPSMWELMNAATSSKKSKGEGAEGRRSPRPRGKRKKGRRRSGHGQGGSKSLGSRSPPAPVSSWQRSTTMRRSGRRAGRRTIWSRRQPPPARRRRPRGTGREGSGIDRLAVHGGRREQVDAILVGEGEGDNRAGVRGQDGERHLVAISFCWLGMLTVVPYTLF